MRWCCIHCGRNGADVPGGLWFRSRQSHFGICVWCARAALRAPDPDMPQAVIAFARPAQSGPEPPEAA